MKSPSKNISSSLRGQAVGGRSADAPSVSKQRAPTASDNILPGESGVENPPGTPPERTTKSFADATGRIFGGRS